MCCHLGTPGMERVEQAMIENSRYLISIIGNGCNCLKVKGAQARQVEEGGT